MNYMKHCDLLRQTCPEPMKCGNGCQCAFDAFKDNPLPIVMHDKPRRWAKDLVYNAVWTIGIVASALTAGLVIAYFYARLV